MARFWTRTYCEYLIRLDVRGFLPGRTGRPNLLQPGNTFVTHWEHHGEVTHAALIRVTHDYLTIEWASAGLPQQATLALERTGCHLGGSRTWLLCPRCGKRVAVLFGWGRFQCRACIGADFKCQSETKQDRALRRAGKLRRRLGWAPGVINPKGGRPKGMHSNVYANLLATYHREEKAIYGGFRDWLASMRR